MNGARQRTLPVAGSSSPRITEERRETCQEEMAPGPRGWGP